VVRNENPFVYLRSWPVGKEVWFVSKRDIIENFPTPVMSDSVVFQLMFFLLKK
jgi:hypothetical protein